VIGRFIETDLKEEMDMVRLNVMSTLHLTKYIDGGSRLGREEIAPLLLAGRSEFRAAVTTARAAAPIARSPSSP
jgi:hypothetical protein